MLKMIILIGILLLLFVGCKSGGAVPDPIVYEGPEQHVIEDGGDPPLFY